MKNSDKKHAWGSDDAKVVSYFKGASKEQRQKRMKSTTQKRSEGKTR